jgi:hypothetical protein
MEGIMIKSDSQAASPNAYVWQNPTNMGGSRSHVSAGAVVAMSE